MRQLRDPALLGAVAAAILAFALQRSSGMYDPLALALACATVAFSLAAAFAPAEIRGHPTGFAPATEIREIRGHPTGFEPARIHASGLPRLLAANAARPLFVQLALGAGIAHGLYCHLFLVPWFYGNPALLQPFRALAAAAAFVLSAYLCQHLRPSLQRVRFFALLAIFAAMAVLVLRSAPVPHIDVFYFRAIAARALRAFVDPYSISFPHLYGEAEGRLYGRFFHDNRVWFYPYPPLIPLLDALVPDPRLVSIAGMIVSALVLRRLARGPTGELAAFLLLFQGRAFFVVEQAWTEPVTLAFFSLALLLAREAPRRVPQWLALGIAAGLCAASKQYSPLLVIALLVATPRALRLRVALLAFAVVAATFAPFLAWDAQGLINGVALVHIHGLFPDSLSLLTLWARNAPLPAWAQWPSFVAGFGVLGVSLRMRGGAARAAMAAGASWLLIVLLSLQAFCNYDWLGAGLLCAGVAAWSGERAGETR